MPPRTPSKPKFDDERIASVMKSGKRDKGKGKAAPPDTTPTARSKGKQPMSAARADSENEENNDEEPDDDPEQRTHQGRKRAAEDNDDGELDEEADANPQPTSATQQTAPRAKRARTGGAGSADKKFKNRPESEKRALIEERSASVLAEIIKGKKFYAQFPKQGVYVCDVPVSAEKQSTIAGYLNLVDTHALHEFIFETNKAIFDGFLATWQDAKATLSFPSVLTALDDGHITRTIIDLGPGRFPKTNPLFWPRSKATQNLCLYKEFMCFADELIRLNPDNFTGAFEPSISRKYVAGCNFEAEDLYRVYIVANMAKRVASKKREGDGTSKDPNYALARKAFYRIPGLGRENTEEEEARTRLSLQNILYDDITGKGLLADCANTLSGTFGVDPAFDNHERTITNRKVSVGEEFASLTTGQRDIVLKSLTKGLQYLYKDRQHMNTMFHEVIQQMSDPLQHVANAQNLGAALGDEDNTLNARRFTKLQRTMNARSAKLPDWETTVRELGLKVVDLPEGELDPLTQQTFQVFFRGFQLMPWQAQAILWMSRMLTGPLRAALNADDTGLGKTITSYLTVLFMADMTETRREEWEAGFREHIQIAYAAAISLREANDHEGVEAITMESIAEDPDVREAYEQTQGRKPIYRPSFVTCPPAALGAWLGDASKIQQNEGTPLRLRTFYSTGNKKDRQTTQALAIGAEPMSKADGTRMSKAEILDKTVAELSSEDKTTACTLILTTHRTWANRVLDAKRRADQTRPAAKQSRNDGGEDSDSDEIDEDDIAQDGEEEYVETLEFAELLIPNKAMFEVTIVDEAHGMKNLAALQTQAVHQLDDCAYLLITATPFMHSVRDMSGLLRFPFKHIRHWYPDDEDGKIAASEGLTRDEYRSLGKRFEEQFHGDFFEIPEEEHVQFCRALNPRKFFLLTNGAMATEDMSVGMDVVPLPTAMTTMRRVMHETIEVNGKTIELGADIPHYEITTVELEMGSYEAGLYNYVHYNETQAKTGFPGGDDDDDETGNARFITPPRRRLLYAAFNPVLDNLWQKGAAFAAKLIASLDREKLDALKYVIKIIRPSPNAPEPNDRVQALQWLVALSSKLKVLCEHILTFVLGAGEKLIVYADWPMTILLVELVVTLLQIPIVSIRAGVSNQARLDAEIAFNNDPNVMVLVCSSRSAAQSLNLQQGGHRMIILDWVPINTILQCVGRQFRIGQRHPQFITVVTLDGTIDQKAQAHSHALFRQQVAATMDLEAVIRPEDRQNIPEEARTHGETEAQATTGDGMPDNVRSALHEATADAIVCQLLGTRSSRRGDWNHYRRPELKNLIPEETMFRLMSGGYAQKLMMQELRQSRAEKGEEKEEPSPARRLHPDQKPPKSTAERNAKPNPYAPGMKHRPTENEIAPFTEADVVQEIYQAATTMSEGLAHTVRRYTASRCIEQVMQTVMYPAREAQLALDHARRTTVSLATPKRRNDTLHHDLDLALPGYHSNPSSPKIDPSEISGRHGYDDYPIPSGGRDDPMDLDGEKPKEVEEELDGDDDAVTVHENQGEGVPKELDDAMDDDGATPTPVEDDFGLDDRQATGHENPGKGVPVAHDADVHPPTQDQDEPTDDGVPDDGNEDEDESADSEQCTVLDAEGIDAILATCPNKALLADLAASKGFSVDLKSKRPDMCESIHAEWVAEQWFTTKTAVLEAITGMETGKKGGGKEVWKERISELGITG